MLYLFLLLVCASFLCIAVLDQLLRRRGPGTAVFLIVLGGAAGLTGFVHPLLPFNARDIEMGTWEGLGALYFPGDAPLVDVFSALSGVLTILVLVVAATAYGICRLSRATRAWRVIRAILMVPALLGSLAGTHFGGSILGRHVGEWRELRALLRRYSEAVGREAPDPSRLLTYAEVQVIESKVLTPRPTFRARAFQEPLRLRIMNADPPYVGVDFGHGRNAVFDLRTIACIYSD